MPRGLTFKEWAAGTGGTSYIAYRPRVGTFYVHNPSRWPVSLHETVAFLADRRMVRGGPFESLGDAIRWCNDVARANAHLRAYDRRTARPVARLESSEDGTTWRRVVRYG